MGCAAACEPRPRPSRTTGYRPPDRNGPARTDHLSGTGAGSRRIRRSGRIGTGNAPDRHGWPGCPNAHRCCLRLYPARRQPVQCRGTWRMVLCIRNRNRFGRRRLSPWSRAGRCWTVRKPDLYDELLADFIGPFHDLRGCDPVPTCLASDPAEAYPAGQALARSLREAGGNGIVYPSARRVAGPAWQRSIQASFRTCGEGRSGIWNGGGVRNRR